MPMTAHLVLPPYVLHVNYDIQPWHQLPPTTDSLCYQMESLPKSEMRNAVYLFLMLNCCHPGSVFIFFRKLCLRQERLVLLEEWMLGVVPLYLAGDNTNQGWWLAVFTLRTTGHLLLPVMCVHYFEHHKCWCHTTNTLVLVCQLQATS